MGTIISSVVFGEARLWEYWFLKSLKKVMPDASYHKVVPDFEAINARLLRTPPHSYAAYPKVQFPALFGMGEDFGYPVWIVDCDLLFLHPLTWRPGSGETVLAMAKGGDAKYLDFVKQAGVPVRENVTFNCGVIWGFDDFSHTWDKWYNRICDAVEGTPYSIGETMWNAIWHDYNNQGRAEILPQNYNQLCTEHGPHGAVIFHFAGTPHQFRGKLMESYYKHFFPEEDNSMEFNAVETNPHLPWGEVKA